ncbi:MAG: hypothetical protein LUE12_04255 [Ruminococcus sp.]|nr:hypothetical protein [Ruminococcus sp.]
MNILYCGDENIKDGLLISILSLLKNTNDSLCIYVMTMRLETDKKSYNEIDDAFIEYLDRKVKEKHGESFVKKLDCAKVFSKMPPDANMGTRFTPYCMLRLYADQFDELDGKLLYLDNDVICRRDISDFYNQDIGGCELVGVLDHYGKWFFRKCAFHMDYINSGVLLLNIEKIRETKLFESCRKMCAEKKMFMPDQSAINKLSKQKKIAERKFNEQRKLRDETILQHFTTSFRFFPLLHTITVKPWQVDKIHSRLKLHEYDDILNEYLRLNAQL